MFRRFVRWLSFQLFAVEYVWKLEKRRTTETNLIRLVLINPCVHDVVYARATVASWLKDGWTLIEEPPLRGDWE